MSRLFDRQFVVIYMVKGALFDFQGRVAYELVFDALDDRFFVDGVQLILDSGV